MFSLESKLAVYNQNDGDEYEELEKKLSGQDGEPDEEWEGGDGDEEEGEFEDDEEDYEEEENF